MEPPRRGGAETASAVALGGLLVSVIRPNAPILVLRAVKWACGLERLGVYLPLFLVHDVGLLYAVPREQFSVGRRQGFQKAEGRYPELATLVDGYEAFLGEIAEGEACRRARSLRLGDDLIVVLLARILEPLKQKTFFSLRDVSFDLERISAIDSVLPQLFLAEPRGAECSVLASIQKAGLHVLTLSDALDVDTLRLLGMFAPESNTAGALAHVDLLAAMGNPMANDVVNFSLELLPSVLKTRHSPSSGTYAMEGYSGIGTRGSIDSMVLTELGWDKEEFVRRMLDSELLFYTRERTPEQSRRLHYLLIDASASMRGDRQVFARGLAIALARRLQLSGEEVWFRFFDSRLYEVQRARTTQLPVAYLLGFRGERGRHPARVFAQLATEIELLRARDARDPVVHLLTHAALEIPRATVSDIAKMAHVFGVFILPSGGKLDLDYLDLLGSHAVVDHATLTQRALRSEAATRIVDQATRRNLATSAETVGRAVQSEEAIPPSLRTPRTLREPS